LLPPVVILQESRILSGPIFGGQVRKRALFGVLIVGGLIGGAGIKLVAPHGIVAFLSFSSIIVVLYAIFISMQSLQLARDTQRPFLNVMGTVRYALYEYSDEGKSSIQAIKFSISNEGAFPADEVSISCNVCKERGNDDWHLLSLSRENAIPSICFPHQEIKCRFEEKPDDKEALRIEPSDKLRVLITINYKQKT